MKGGRKHRESGGENAAEEDIKDKPEMRVNATKIKEEAEELKKGGRAKKARGGKLVGKVEGEKGAMHAGRKPRKSGGRTGSEANPFTGARKGNDAPGRKIMKDEQDSAGGED
jgi:hypothetical protein